MRVETIANRLSAYSLVELASTLYLDAGLTVLAASEQSQLRSKIEVLRKRITDTRKTISDTASFNKLVIDVRLSTIRNLIKEIKEVGELISEYREAFGVDDELSEQERETINQYKSSKRHVDNLRAAIAAVDRELRSTGKKMGYHIFQTPEGAMSFELKDYHQMADLGKRFEDWLDSQKSFLSLREQQLTDLGLKAQRYQQRDVAFLSPIVAEPEEIRLFNTLTQEYKKSQEEKAQQDYHNKSKQQQQEQFRREETEKQKRANQFAELDKSSVTVNDLINFDQKLRKFETTEEYNKRVNEDYTQLLKDLEFDKTSYSKDQAELKLQIEAESDPNKKLDLQRKLGFVESKLREADKQINKLREDQIEHRKRATTSLPGLSLDETNYFKDLQRRQTLDSLKLASIKQELNTSGLTGERKTALKQAAALMERNIKFYSEQIGVLSGIMRGAHKNYDLEQITQPDTFNTDPLGQDLSLLGDPVQRLGNRRYGGDSLDELRELIAPELDSNFGPSSFLRDIGDNGAAKFVNAEDEVEDLEDPDEPNIDNTEEVAVEEVVEEHIVDTSDQLPDGFMRFEELEDFMERHNKNEKA